MHSFSAIVQRAIVDQSQGTQSFARLERLDEYALLTASFRDLEEDEILTWKGDCSLPLDLRNLDPAKEPGTLLATIDLAKPKVAVFFRGRVPDVSPYLNSENWDALLAPRPENFKSLSTDEFLKLTSIEVNDHRFWMKALTSQGRKIISWRGNECEGYSYIIFEGVRK